MTNFGQIRDLIFGQRITCAPFALDVTSKKMTVYNVTWSDSAIRHAGFHASVNTWHITARGSAEGLTTCQWIISNQCQHINEQSPSRLQCLSSVFRLTWQSIGERRHSQRYRHSDCEQFKLMITPVHTRRAPCYYNVIILYVAKNQILMSLV